MAEREDHVSPLDISRDLCVRGGVEGALLGLVVRWCCSCLMLACGFSDW